MGAKEEWRIASALRVVEVVPDYRRHRIPGGTYFFTVNLRDRGTRHLVTHINLLRAAVRETRRQLPFHIDACVVLPDHLHCLWTLPAGDADYPNRWRIIKAAFSKQMPQDVAPNSARLRPGERGIWQRRYWEHTIRDERDFAAHMDYVHLNPVKHGLVRQPMDWPYSTFRRCVALGLYPAAWNGDDGLLTVTGERSGLR